MTPASLRDSTPSVLGNEVGDRELRRVSTHPTARTVACRLERRRIALASHHVGPRTHRAGNQGEFTVTCTDRTLAEVTSIGSPSMISSDT